MNKTRMFTIATFIEHIFGSPSHTIRKEKETKGIQVVKGNTFSVSLLSMMLAVCLTYTVLIMLRWGPSVLTF